MEVEQQDWVLVPIRVLVNYLSDSGISYDKMAKLWGISKLQVSNYSNGKTKRPSVLVAKAILDTTKFEGKKAVINVYADESHLLTSYKMFHQAE